jgi:hypothetical protein
MPLYPSKPQIPPFPAESDGTTRVRYPATLALPGSAPASTTLANGNMSLVPYYIGSKISGASISAKSTPLIATSGGSGLVGLYSTPTGLASATLVSSATYTLASSASQQSPVVSFSLASGELQSGWYIVAAVNTSGSVSNSGLFTVQNFSILGTSTAANVVGTYGLSSAKVITGVTSALPANLSGSTDGGSSTTIPLFFLIY